MKSPSVLVRNRVWEKGDEGHFVIQMLLWFRKLEEKCL